MTLENLLNALIQRGWKPFGWKEREAKKGSYNNLYYGFDSHPELHHIRMLVSKESGLWQFVCENGMVDKTQYNEDRAKNYDEYKNECDTAYNGRRPEYRIIESALKDESEIEDFLLNSIKLD